jgi:hypothetical protein
MKLLRCIVLGVLFYSYLQPLKAQQAQMQIYYNPINLDYTYMIYSSDKNNSYRSRADPTVVESVVNITIHSMDYWHSFEFKKFE